MIAAGGDDELVAVDERGFADEPMRIAAFEILQNIFPPDLGSILGVKAGEFAVLAKDVKTISIGGGRAARSGATVLVQAAAERRSPDDLAVGATQAEDDAVAALDALHVDMVAF